MDSSSTGARVMVKIIFALLLFATTPSYAVFYAGVQNNSWQDVIPVTYTDSVTSQKVSIYALTTFTSLSAGGGYEGQLFTRWRYTGDLYIHTGTADILKLQGTTSPRKSFTSQWASFKINYRISKTFAMGPQLVVNAVTINGAGSATSLGVLINTDIEMSDNLRLIQNFGSMNDSGTIAYSIGLQKYF